MEWMTVAVAEKLADQLLRHASKVEQQAREGNALWVD